MEKTVNQQLDELFNKEWKPSYTDPQKLEKFATDGLVYKYKKVWRIEGKERPTLAGTDADKYVEDKWNKSPLKIVFLLKDKSDNSGGDVRQWFLYEKEGKCSRDLAGGNVGKTGFLPNMARMLYGIMHIKELEYENFEDFKKKYKKDIVEAWNTLPFAFVETKKIAGKPQVSDKEIQAYIDSDGKFLKKELDLIQPNVIICTCDPHFDFITKEYLANEEIEQSDKIVYQYPDAPFVNCCLWYYKRRNIAVVKSYHPTNRGKIQWTISERVVSPFRKLLEKHPEYFKDF